MILQGWDSLLALGQGFTRAGSASSGGTSSSAITIEKDVTIFQGVTIGMKHKISAGGRVSLIPTIEDEMWIGPYAVIAGDGVVGRGSRIAPGTVVTGDVAPYTIVGGDPMRVIKTDAFPDVLNPA